MTSGGIFIKGNSDVPSCYVKEHYKGIYRAKFTTTEGRDLTCAKSLYQIRFRYYPLDQQSQTLTMGDNQYITNLPMESVATFNDPNLSNSETIYEEPAWGVVGAEKLRKEGNCMWKDTASTAMEFGDAAKRYFVKNIGKKCV